jgi:hypothetical protein
MAKRSNSPCFAKADLKPKDIERLELLAEKYNSTNPNADYAAAAQDMIAEAKQLRDAIYKAMVEKAKTASAAPTAFDPAKGAQQVVGGDGVAREFDAQGFDSTGKSWLAYAPKDQKKVAAGATIGAFYETTQGQESRSESAGPSGNTVEAVKKAVFKFLPIKSDLLQVLANPSELPADVRKQYEAERKGKKGNAQGLVWGGKAYLFSDFIKPGEERAIFMHEVGSHVGLEGDLTDEEHRALAFKIVEWAQETSGTQENKIAQAAMRRVSNASVAPGQQQSELVAYFIEEAVRAGVNPEAEMKKNTKLGNWFAKVMDFAKKAIARFVGDIDTITAQDLVNMAYGRAAQAMIDNRSAGDKERNPRDAVPKFSELGLPPTSVPAKQNQSVAQWAKLAKENRNAPAMAGIAQVTPPVMRMLGFYSPVVMDYGNVRHIFNKHPEITVSDIGALGDLLTRPRAVIQTNNSVVMILDSRDKAGNPLFMAMTKGKTGEFKITEVKTLFGGEESAQVVATALRDGRVLYMRKADMGRLHDLQSTASIAINPGDGAPNVQTPTSKGILSDRALEAFKKDSKGNWATLTETMPTASKAQIDAMRPMQFSISAPVSDAARRVGGASSAILAESASHFVKKLGLSMLGLHDIVDRYKNTVPAIGEWYKSVQDVVAQRTRYEREAEEIAHMADKLPGGTQKINDFISRSTYEQKWGYTPTFKTDVTVDPVLKSMYDQLTDKEQAVVREVFAHGEKMRKVRDALLKKLGADKIFSGYAKIDGPYAPLKRFGDYVAVLKSKELRDAEEAKDDKLVEKLKADPTHYVMSKFDTKGQARQFAWANNKANGGRFDFTDDFEGSARIKEDQPVPYKVVQDILAAMKINPDMESSERSAAVKMINDMMLQYVDEHNARMSGLRRLNRAGYDTDMMRSFLAHSRAESSFLANVEHGATISEAFQKMQGQARNSLGEREHQDAVNTVAEHYADMLHYKETPIQDRLMAGTSAWQLATSVGYHVTNFTQGIMVSLPKLAADFGDYSGAWRHLIDGYRMVGRAGIGNKFDINKIQSPGLKKALQLAMDMGVLDVGMNEDMSHFEATRTGIGGIDKSTKLARSALHKLNQVARGVEIVNRVSSATAAYNMAIAKGRSEEQAQQYALRMLQSTQGDFSRVGSPLLLKKLPKIVTQYKKYQFMMAALYAKAFQQAFRSSDPKERAIGRRMLAYKMAHTGIAAGALGLPLMNLVSMIFGALGGDEEPPDLERSLRELIGDETMANMLLHGPLSAAGLDMSAKLGDDKIFSILPYGEWDFSSASGLAKTGMSLAGPAAGLGGKFADGVGMLQRGEYYKGVEKFMPKGAADAMKAFRIANEGFTLKNGDLMFKPEDVNGFALALDALGMPSSEMKRMDWLRSQQYEIGQFYQDRTKEIQRDYARAVEDKDQDSLTQLRQDWMDLQSGKNRLRYLFNDSTDALKVQPLSTLLKYPQTQAKREQKLQKAAGVTG